MGCDIYAVVQIRRGDKWVRHPYEFFDDRNYRLFGWLADVRNYSAVRPISLPRGLPLDHGLELPPDEFEYFHSWSWLTSSELAEVDYDQFVEDRRTTVIAPQGWRDGSATCEAGLGEFMLLRQFLGKVAMDDIYAIIRLGDARLIFGFED
jgi:hypothetical protein